MCWGTSRPQTLLLCFYLDNRASPDTTPAMTVTTQLRPREFCGCYFLSAASPRYGQGSVSSLPGRMNFPDSSEAFRCVSQEGESGGTPWEALCLAVLCTVVLRTARWWLLAHSKKLPGIFHHAASPGNKAETSHSALLNRLKS